MWEAYAIGVRLSLINGVSSGLVAMSGQFHTLGGNVTATQAKVTSLQQSLHNLKVGGLVSGAVAGAGVAGLALLKAPLDEAKKFQLEVARFESLGLGAAMNHDAVQFATAMKTYGTSMSENMALFRDAQTVFRDSDSLHHAEMVTPMLAKMKFANETLYGSGKASQMEGKFMDMLRVIELRKGLNNEAEFAQQANMIQQVLTTSGGRVDATQYLNLIKTGGVAAKSLSNQAVYYQLEPIIQEMGGFRVGTGLMSAYQNLVIGRMLGQRPADELKRLGLLDEKNIVRGTSGHIKEFKDGALKGSEILQASPVDFLEKVLLPAFTAHGITKEKDILRELGVIFSNRTASNLFGTIYQQLPQIRKGEQLSAKALNIDQADEKARTTLGGKEIELHKKWADALNHLGTSVLPIAIKGVEGLTGVITGFNRFAERFPGLTKGLAISFGALATAMAIGGTIGLVTIGFKALGLALTLLSAGSGGGLIAATSGALLSLGGAIRGLFSVGAVLPLLTMAATGLGGVGIKLLAMAGPVTMLAAAGGVGFGIGTLIYNLLEGTKAIDWFGKKVAQILAFMGNKEAQEALGYKPAPEAPTRPKTALEQFYAGSSNQSSRYFGLNSTGGGGRGISVANVPPPAAIPTAGFARGPVRPMDEGAPALYAKPDKAPATGSPYIAQRPQTQTIQVTSQVNLDGRRVGEAVTKHQTTEAGRALASSTGFDGSMFLAPVAMR